MKKILYIFLGIIAFLVITMFVMGKKYHFETSTVINVSAEKVYAHMSSMKGFNQWNPWLDLDPTFHGFANGEILWWRITKTESTFGKISLKYI